MNDTAIAHAFAQAKPAAQPPINKVTRTPTGLRFWWSNNVELVGRRFTCELDGDTAHIRECGEGEGVRIIRRNNQSELAFYKLGSDKPFAFSTNVKPTFTNGRLHYDVNGIQQHATNTNTNAPNRTESRTWTDRTIRTVLAHVRDIEASTSWRLSHDSKSSLAVFIARIEL